LHVSNGFADASGARYFFIDKEDVWIYTFILGSPLLCLQVYYAFFSEKINETAERMLPLD